MFFDFADIISMIVGCDSCDPFILSWSTFLRPSTIFSQGFSGASVHWDRAVGTVPLQHPSSREGGNGEESKTVK